MIAPVRKNYAKIVADYCEAVRSGERVAGRYEIMAVQRYERDRNEAEARGYIFDEEIAQKSCWYYPLVLRHTMGEWEGEPFELSPWQVFVEWNLSGWRCMDDNARRFRKSFVDIARKNGKTTWAAAKLIQTSFSDIPATNRGRAYCAATKQEQAALTWGESARMIDAVPWLRDRCKILGLDNIKGGVIHVNDGTTMQPLGADGSKQDGLNPSVVVKDEYHEWRQKHRKLDEKLSTGGASRFQPIELIFTTHGDDDSEVWAEEYDFCCRVVEAGSRGQVVDDTVFAFICTIDDEDDPLDEKVWPKANPNYGVSVKPRYLQTKANEAREKPSSLDAFVRYHANRRTASFDQAYPSHLWDRAIQSFPEPEPGDLCFVGVDLGRTNDWAAWSAVFPQSFIDSEGTQRWRYKIKSKPYCCKGPNVKTKYDKPPYSLWIRDGLLGYQPDEVIDTSELKQDILDLSKLYELKSMPYDDSFAKEFALDLFNSYGIPVFAYYQTHLRYNEPLIAFEKSLLAGLIDHGNCPVLNFQAGNCQYHYDPKGRRMIDKGNQQRWKKIDSMVAMIMAFGEAIYHAKNETNDDVLIVPTGAG